MHKEKRVWKYGRLLYSLRCLKYNLHMGFLPPFLLLILAALIMSLFAAFSCLVMTVCGLLVGASDLQLPVGSLLVSGLVAGGSSLLLRCVCTAPEGHFLNPVPPEENVVLPDADLLVRASSSAQAQPAELLRAAQRGREEKPEELLHSI